MNKDFSLGLLLCDVPFEIVPKLKLYQPTVRDVVLIGEERYSMLLKVWSLERHQLIIQETAQSETMNDNEIWTYYMINEPTMREALEQSCLIFFHKKIEFFPISNTIYIGEGNEGVLLDLNLYLTLKTLFSKLDFNRSNSDEEQYKDTANMTERERKIYERIQAGKAKIAKIKGSDYTDTFGKQISGLVAIGHYTYKEVYDMTMLQFTTALKKYLDIERYELMVPLSPFMSSKDGSNQENKHWLM